MNTLGGSAWSVLRFDTSIFNVHAHVSGPFYAAQPPPSSMPILDLLLFETFVTRALSNWRSDFVKLSPSSQFSSSSSIAILFFLLAPLIFPTSCCVGFFFQTLLRQEIQTTKSAPFPLCPFFSPTLLGFSAPLICSLGRRFISPSLPFPHNTVLEK